MNPFPLKIVTPGGLMYEGQARELIVRTVTGDLGILAGHTNCVAPLGKGVATVILEEETRYGVCIGGMVSVLEGEVTLLPAAFEWADQKETAQAALSKRGKK